MPSSTHMPLGSGPKSADVKGKELFLPVGRTPYQAHTDQLGVLTAQLGVSWSKVVQSRWLPLPVYPFDHTHVGQFDRTSCDQAQGLSFFRRL